MTNTPRRIAILIELPKNTVIEMVAFRRMIKAFARSFGLRCVGMRDPKDSETFKNETSTKQDPPRTDAD